MEIIKEKACCFTGHRKISADFHKESLPKFIIAMNKASGVDTFICGGALGFDMIAAEAVLECKKLIPELKLVMFLPCKDQNARWTEAQKEKYAKILAKADYIDCPDTNYYNGVMRIRNYKMVDNSSYCICYCNTKVRSGTYQTVAYARKCGIPVYNCCPFIV